MKNKTNRIIMGLMLLIAVCITGCRTTYPAITDLLVNIGAFAGKEDLTNWDGKTLEEQREVLVKAKEIAPVALIDWIDKEIEKIDEKIRVRNLPPEPTPTPKPPVDHGDDECRNLPANPPATRKSMLWKPVSERGSLVVLLSRPYSGHVLRVELSSGEVVKPHVEVGKPHGLGNGCREHYRWPKSGSAYNNVTLRAYLDDGQIHEWKIGNGSQRVEF